VTGYDFYLDKIRLPVAPQKLTVKITGQNKTVVLINEGEINILKKAGLTEITFTALLPNVPYPFARYAGGYKNASYFLDALESLKTRTGDDGRPLPFQFIVSRASPGGKALYDTDIKVSLESYEVSDDARQGLDVSVGITLKQYKTHGTKVVELRAPTPASPKAAATVEPSRPVETAPREKTYTVVKGDSLWAIARAKLGDGGRYPEIYALNRAEIDGRNEGTGNLRHTIYPGQALVLP
jgi:hypothetical protein